MCIIPWQEEGRDPQAKEYQRWPAAPRHGGEAWVSFSLTSSEETFPADTLLDF